MGGWELPRKSMAKTCHSGDSKVTFLGWLSDPFKGLSDLQLGDNKVPLNHLAVVFFQKKSSLLIF